jgi:probable F420-dependent oxidoreductase
MASPRIDLACVGRTVPESIEIIRASEAAGWQGAWITEINGMDGVTHATAAACNLKAGRTGSAILPMQTRDPLLMAMTATSISQVAQGGFVLGLGTSTKIIIEDWHATDWGKPLALTRDYVSLVRRFLAGERVTTEQGRWRYRRAQLGARPKGDIPIYLAALNDGMLRLAGEIADGVILNFVTPRDLEHARKLISEGAAISGRNLDQFELMVFFRASVTDDYERVRERYQRELFTYIMSPVYQSMFDREGYGEDCKKIESMWRAGQREEALAAIPPALIQQRALIGSAADIRARLDDYMAVGLQTALTLPVAIPDQDYKEDTLRTISELSVK